MAVKPITNKQVVSSTNINRGKEVSTKNIKGGNREMSINPGTNLGKNYAVTLKDVDTTVITHVKNVIKPSIREANETIKVPVLYGNEERWLNARKRGVLRDKNGALILPLIMLRRTDITRNTLAAGGFEHDIKRQYVDVMRGSTWSKDNRYDRFKVQTGMKPVYESIATGVPDFVDITYEFILWTNFIEQMNPLVELFVAEENKYWGNSTEYKFLCNFDTIADASEMSIEGERMIKSTFTVTTKAYLLPEYINSVVTNKISNLKRRLTPSRVTFGYEGDATNEEVGKK